MVVSCGHRDSRAPTGQADLHRRGAVGGGAITELAGGVVAPAVQRGIVEHCAGVTPANPINRGPVVAPYRDRDSGSPTGQADCHRRGAVGGRAVAEGTAVVVAPAVQRAVVEDGAGVQPPCGHRRDCASGGQVDCDWRAAAVDSIHVASVGAVAELAGEVVAPAVQRGVVGHSAAMGSTYRHREG